MRKTRIIRIDEPIPIEKILEDIIRHKKQLENIVNMEKRMKEMERQKKWTEASERMKIKLQKEKEETERKKREAEIKEARLELEIRKHNKWVRKLPREEQILWQWNPKLGTYIKSIFWFDPEFDPYQFAEEKKVKKKKEKTRRIVLALNELNIMALRKLGKKQGVRGYSRLEKKELIDKIIEITYDYSILFEYVRNYLYDKYFDKYSKKEKTKNEAGDLAWNLSYEKYPDYPVKKEKSAEEVTKKQEIMYKQLDELAKKRKEK